MVSSWEPDAIDDEIEPIDNSIRVEYYPNPFNEQVEIRVFTESETTAGISIYDINGQKVRGYDITLNNGAGMTTWDSKNQKGQKVATGNYIMKIDFPDGKEIRKVITLLK